LPFVNSLLAFSGLCEEVRHLAGQDRRGQAGLSSAAMQDVAGQAEGGVDEGKVRERLREIAR